MKKGKQLKRRVKALETDLRRARALLERVRETLQMLGIDAAPWGGNWELDGKGVLTDLMAKVDTLTATVFAPSQPDGYDRNDCSECDHPWDYCICRKEEPERKARPSCFS